MAHWREFLDPAAPAGAYLAWKDVQRRTSLSRTTAWRLQRRDEFPRPYRISPGRVGHREAEIEAWMASRGMEIGRAPAGGQRRPALTVAEPPKLVAEAGPSTQSSPHAPELPAARHAPGPSARRRPRGDCSGGQITFNF